MKKIDFVFIGTPKDPSFKKLEEDYHKKIKRYFDSAISCIKDSPEKNIAIKQKKETEKILEKIKPGDVLVLCDERGRSLDSVAFSKKISGWQVAGQRVVFVVGGAFGLSELANTRTREHANSQPRNLASSQVQFLLKLSDMTLPHELARVVLLEQVYRALTILNGEKYHH